ncbi:MAG: ABC transporter permease [Acidimicrobiia bacterium]
MIPILALFGATYRSALPLRRTVLFGVLSLFPAVLFMLVTEDRTGEAAFEALLETSTGSFFALLLPIISIVIASGALGSERRDQTLSFIVLRPIPRPAVGATKIAAAACAAMTINTIGVVGAWAIFAVRHRVDTTLLVGLLVGMAIATIAYVAVVVPIGFMTDRAVIIGLAYLLVFENGIVIALSGLSPLSPWRVGLAAVGGIAKETQPVIGDAVGTLTMSAGGSIVTLGIYLAIGVTVTAMLLRRRDLA